MTYPYSQLLKEGNKLNASIVKYEYYFFNRCVLLGAIVLFSGCAGVPEIKTTTNYSPIVSYALSLQGTPYRYGKNSPEEGFDCSGFVQHVYGHQGIALPRTVQKMAQSVALTQVPKNNLHSGDLLFFNTNGNPFSHVGIYVSDNTFIHAPSQRTGKVLVSSLKNRYWGDRFSCARRP
ncbi:MAG: C40 family peptidase [Methylobacter sp.]|nr:C40 family peptidase [Methylobacter sp.]